MLSYVISGLQGLNARAGGNISYFNTAQIYDAVSAAQFVDAVVYFIGTDSGEGSDRGSLSFAQLDIDLISALAAVNKNVVVGNYKFSF